MEYSERSRNGDAGEHLVVFRVTKLLGWPCRLLPVDLGIDAEVEILTDSQCVGGGTSQTATGDVIKLQIKSVASLETDQQFSIPTTEKHIAYWAHYSSPVIFCGVDLERERIYWKQITALGDYSTSGKSKKVNFDITKDLLTADTAKEWRRFASPDEVHKLVELMEYYELYLAETADSAGDRTMCQIYGEWFREAKLIEDRIANIVRYLPWKMTSSDLTKFESTKKILLRRKQENQMKEIELNYN